MKKVLIVVFIGCMGMSYGQDYVHLWGFEKGKITHQFCKFQKCEKKETFEKEELLYCLNSRFQLEVTNRKKLLEVYKGDVARQEEVKEEMKFFDKTKQELEKWIDSGIKNNFQDEKLKNWLHAVSSGVPYLRKKRASH